MKPSLLIVDDEYRVRQSLAIQMERKGYAVASAASGKEALAQLELRSFKFALIDLRLGEMSGLELLRRMKAQWPDTVVLIMTAYSDISTAIEAIKAGAFHYLAKPIQMDELLDALTNAEPARRKDPFHGVVGESSAMRNALALARRAAESDKPVLITGEVGTGKETLAAAIHAGSARAGAPLVPVRCTNSPSLEDVIFGHSASTPGRLMESNGGTLVLDTVSEMSLPMQERLLRFLLDGEVRWEGVSRVMKTNVRFIATSVHELTAAVESKLFLDELRLRLTGIHIQVPPLRERPQDIPVLVKSLIEKYTPRGQGRVKIEKDALETLQRLPLRGNNLELEATVEQAVSLANDSITSDVLRMAGVDESPASSDESRHPLKEDLEKEERKLIEESLTRNGHNLRIVAVDLEISRTSLWRKMKRFGLAE